MTPGPCVEPTEVATWVRSGYARPVEGGGLAFEINPNWALTDETQVGYPIIARLIECVREHHWASVVGELNGVHPTVRSLKLEFLRPLEVGLIVIGTATFDAFHRHSFDLGLQLSAGSDVAVDGLMRCVLIDAGRRLVPIEEVLPASLFM